MDGMMGFPGIPLLEFPIPGWCHCGMTEEEAVPLLVPLSHGAGCGVAVLQLV